MLGEIIKYAKWVFAERMAGLLVLGGFVAQVAGAEEWDDKMRVGGVLGTDSRFGILMFALLEMRGNNGFRPVDFH